MDNITRHAINNIMPGNQVYKLGDLIQSALNGYIPRDPDLIRYVNARVESSGDGLNPSSGFKRFREGIAWLNTQSGKGATLLVMPGFYLESAALIPALSANKCLIASMGAQDETVIFGSGTDDVVDAATDHLLKVTGGSNIVIGLSLFVYKNTKSAIAIDDTGGGYHGSFNQFHGIHFSRQAGNGQLYGVYMNGGNYNLFRDCTWTGACKTAGIYVKENEGMPTHNRILGCHFVGTGTAGVLIAASKFYSNTIDNCIFQEGSNPDGDPDTMTYGVQATAACTGGDCLISNSVFTQAAADAIKDQSGASVLIDLNNSTS